MSFPAWSIVVLITFISNSIKTKYPASYTHFFLQSLIRFLVEQRANADWVLPFSNHGREPLHAVYGKNCLPQMGRMIQKERMAIMEIFDQVRTKKVTPEEVATIDLDFLSFLNCNTPEDFEMASKIAQEKEEL